MIFMKWIKKQKSILGIFVLAFILRAIHLNQSFWLDEAAQVIESSRPFLQQFDIAADFHPPLFHILLHFWMLVGHSEIWIRMLSVLFSLGSIYGVYKIGNFFGKKNVGLLSAFFLSIAPYHVWYSQEARPYMMFVFLSVVSTYFLLQKRWIVYTISIIFSLYTHYFVTFILLSHLAYIFIFDRVNLGKIARSFIVAGISFLPWVPSFINQVRTGTNGLFSGWTSVVSVGTILAVPLTIAKFVLGKMPLSDKVRSGFLLAPEVSLFIFSGITILARKTGKILLVFFLVPFVAALFVNLFIPVVAPQRLIFLLPLFVIILSLFLENASKKIKLAGIAIIVFTSTIGLWQYYSNPYIQREDWKSAVSFIQDSQTKDSAVFFAFPSPFAPYIWYYKGNIPSFGLAKDFRVQEDDFRRVSDSIKDKNKLFYFQYLSSLTDPSSKIPTYIQEKGFIEKGVKDFPGVGFVSVYENSH